MSLIYRWLQPELTLASIRILVTAASAMLLGACAGTPPVGLEDALPDAPGTAAARVDPDRYRGAEVRWGGEILGVENLADATEVEIFARPLKGNAEPRPRGGDGVRFIARITGFLDPAEYQRDKRMTVRGRLDAPVTRAVGAYPYLYPVVLAEHFHLWPVYEEPPPHYHYPYYDPWWPWGPWGPYRHPYWR